MNFEQGNWNKHSDQDSTPGVDWTPPVDSVNAYTAWPTRVDYNRNGTIESNEKEKSLSLSYDAARAFLYEREESQGQYLLYRHDALGRLSTISRRLNGTDTELVRYGYTADGRLAYRYRTEIQPIPAEELYLISDGDHVIIERTATATQRTYIWAGATLLKSRATGGVELHLYQDRLGSVVLATKRESGSTSMHGRAQYDPYGNNISNSTWDGDGVGQPYGYTGARWDSLAGLYLMGARWYAPEMGRFVELDPIGEGGGWNLYNYVGSSPTMWVDPTGLKWQGVGPPGHILNPKYASSSAVTGGGSPDISNGIFDFSDSDRSPKGPRSPIPCYVCNNADETGDSGATDEETSDEQESGACEGAEVAAEKPDERLAQIKNAMTSIAKEHGQQDAGKGRAVVDFTKNYLIDGNKLKGGNAWDAMNRSMVQDVLNAQCHRDKGTSPKDVEDPAVSSWMSFANNPTDDTFWKAHDESLFKGLDSKEVQEQRGNMSPQDRNTFDAIVDRALYVEDGLRIGEGVLQQAEWHMQRQDDGLGKSIVVNMLEAGQRLLHSTRDPGGSWVGVVATGYSVFY